MNTNAVIPARGTPYRKRWMGFARAWQKMSLLVVFCACLLIPASTASAQDEWEVVFAPYVWFASVDGHAVVGRSGTQPIDVNIGTLLEDLKMGGMIHLEVRKGQWGFMTDDIYVRLGDNISAPIDGVADFRLEAWIVGTFLTYRLGGERSAFVPYAGIRYYDLGVKLNLEATPVNEAFRRGARWVDPVFGAQVLRYFSKNWFFTGRGDLGGFGAGSDLSWNIQGGVGYDVSKYFAVGGQYRALGVRYDNDHPGTIFEFNYDAVTHGPLVGMIFRF